MTGVLLALVAVSRVIHVQPAVLSVIVGLLIPWLVHLVVTDEANSEVKFLLTTVLSVIGGAVSLALTAGGAIEPGTWLTGIVTTFVTATAAHYGLNQTGVGPALQAKGGFIGPVLGLPRSAVAGREDLQALFGTNLTPTGSRHSRRATLSDLDALETRLSRHVTNEMTRLLDTKVQRIVPRADGPSHSAIMRAPDHPAMTVSAPVAGSGRTTTFANSPSFVGSAAL